MVALRNQQAPGTGLLLLYPISKDSMPETGERGACPDCGVEHRLGNGEGTVRHPLGAGRHIVGVGLVFPASTIGDTGYVANNLAALTSEEAEPSCDREAVDADVEM